MYYPCNVFHRRRDHIKDTQYPKQSTTNKMAKARCDEPSLSAHDKGMKLKKLEWRAVNLMEMKWCHLSQAFDCAFSHETMLFFHPNTHNLSNSTYR